VNTTVGGLARILLIADDRTLSQNYAGALQAAGYDVTQAESFVDVLGTAMPDPDAIVLCELAVFAYPGQAALVIRASNRMAPDELVAVVHRRLAQRDTLLTTVG
jgi:ActR/RegA family two-component response regulator